MKRLNVSMFSTAALLTAAMSSGSYAQSVINISGATLFEDFFAAPASTSDAIDVDNNGVITNFNASPNPIFAQLANTGSSLANVQSGHWAIQYRAVGSGNGLADLVNFGQTPATAAAFGDLPEPDPAYINRSVFFGDSGATGIANASNPGYSPFLSSGGGVKIDIAVSDVPVGWFVTQSGTANWNAAPITSGYGNNAATSNALADGAGNQAGGQGNKLKSLGSLQTGNPGASNNVTSTQIAWVPIAFIANHGTGIDGDGDGTADGNIKKSELQHLYTTGRMTNGENLQAATRDSGSGTRNGAMNSIGVDPSWGVGDNVGLKHADSTNDTLGDEFVPTNKNSSSRMEQTVRTSRLAVGYTGLLGGSKAAEESSNGQYEILNVMNDTDGGTQYVRPLVNNETPTSNPSGFNNVIYNADVDTGWQIGGSESFYTIGDPFAGDIYVDASGNIVATPVDEADFLNNQGGKKFEGNGSGNAEMENKAAALYIRNIDESIKNFVSAPGDPANEGTPGELLASQFVLARAVEALPEDAAPDEFSLNPNVVAALQAQGNLPVQAVPAEYGKNATFSVETDDAYYGRTSVRLQGTGIDYGDGVTDGTSYITNDGTVVAYNENMTGSAAYHARNAIAGDFDGTGLRDASDIDDMVEAYENSGAIGASVTGDGLGNDIASRSNLAGTDANAVLEMLGDFDGNGTFDIEDVRYGADGLFAYGRTGDMLDRKQNFIDVDTAATSGNLFGTTLATQGINGKVYEAGDSRGDVAGSGEIASGWAPVGHDGVVDAQDIDFVYSQFKTNTYVSDNSADWSNLDEAVGFNLSADMTGDMSVNQLDVDELVVTILGTNYGDFNLDRNVSNADVAILRTNLGGSGGWANGDATGDTLVTNADVAQLRANLGSSGSGSLVTATSSASSLVASVVSAAVSGDSIPDFEYDPATGELRFTDDGASAIALTFNTSDDSVKPTETYEASLGTIASWVYNAFEGQDFFEFTDSSFGFNPAANADDYLLALLPTGLSAADFGLVEYQISSDALIRTTGVDVVPEPTALLSVMSGGFILLMRRRRNA